MRQLTKPADYILIKLYDEILEDIKRETELKNAAAKVLDSALWYVCRPTRISQHTMDALWPLLEGKTK